MPDRSAARARILVLKGSSFVAVKRLLMFVKAHVCAGEEARAAPHKKVNLSL
jgi:hypothetical protein